MIDVMLGALLGISLVFDDPYKDIRSRICSLCGIQDSTVSPVTDGQCEKCARKDLPPMACLFCGGDLDAYAAKHYGLCEKCRPAQALGST